MKWNPIQPLASTSTLEEVQWIKEQVKHPHEEAIRLISEGELFHRTTNLVSSKSQWHETRRGPDCKVKEI